MSLDTKKAKSQPNLRYFCTFLLLILSLVVYSGSDLAQASGETLAVWDLNLPERPVSRRVSQRSEFKGKRTFATLTGPGCIRRVWVTGVFISRKDILRIYFDGETIPSVEAPLPDFFGVMHNLTQPGDNYQINTPFLAVKPKLGMTCSIPMPFARNARFEIESPEGSIVYLMVDWHEYPGQQLSEKMRFRARWRREAPVKDFADDYIIADADGPGRLIGFVYAVDMLESRHKMRWSHGGADNIYIDGMGDQPSFLRGIGGEDVFGASHGGADYVAQSSLYSDMPFYIQKDENGDRQKLVGYRFFAHDAIHFYESLHLRFGARAHDVSSTVYWYSEKPVRPYFNMPPVKQRLPQTKILRGEYDIPLPECGTWRLAGPFGKVEPLPKHAGRFDPQKPFIDRPWNKQSSIRGFVEFNHVLRPKASNANSPTLDGWAVAYCTLQAPKDMIADVRLAWDDHLILKINNDPPIDLGSHPYIRTRSVKVNLHEGTNEVQVWLTNRVGVTRGAWNFAFRATTPEGSIIYPNAE